MTNNRLLVAILAIAAIGGTFAVVHGFDLVNNNPQTPLSTSGPMITGNVKVFQYDKDGNIIAYRQTDNHIVKTGMEIIMAQVFGGINTTANYPAAVTLGLPHPVRFMQIGTGGEDRLLHNNTDISIAIAGGTCPRGNSGAGLPATIANTTILGVGQPAHKYPAACVEPNCSAQMNVTAIASFLGSAGCGGAPGNSIDEAGIFDNSTSTTIGQHGLSDGNGGGYMFARNTFGSVNLGVLDTLQLQWEFTFTDS